MSDPKQTRGFRNNNPLDVEDFGIAWQGKQPHSDGPYCVFDTAVNGIRAGAIDLLHAQKLHHRNTVREIVSAYAPPNENATDVYIDRVARYMGVNADTPLMLTSKDVLRKLVAGCMIQEIGGVPYDDATIDAAIVSALAHG